MTVVEQYWGTLTPHQVSAWINFEGRNPDWQYTANNRESMAAKQTEGVAYLWNLLSQERVALLADEVGMGKTFQALGVVALLWKMKPDAKVLVMAPNRDICRHWRREFETFVHRHYRETDHCVRNFVNGGPIPSVQLCFKLNELVEAVEHGVGHLFLTTINTLSGLVAQEDKGAGDPQHLAKQAALKIHHRLKSALDNEGFDLVIVDEAHYLRNIDGGSQRVAAARALFGSEGERLGKHNLLLTATPSHTRLSNVQGILSYFLDLEHFNPDAGKTESELARILLQRFALRRLRLMEGDGGLHSKLHYRNEEPVPSGFEGHPNGEMFFALYQKRLVADLKKQKEGRSLIYGYLEGFESMGRRPDVSELQKNLEDQDMDDSVKEDFSKARDTELLQKLTQDYFDILNDFPEHPKYGAIVAQCLPTIFHDRDKCLTADKHLIFVRRIPSVRELTQRVNSGYDLLLARMIVEAWKLEMNDPAVQQWQKKQWSRDGFNSLLSNLKLHLASDEDAPDDEVTGVMPGENDYLASHIAELFVVKKGEGGQTDCANVRLRFVKPESLFSLFLEPASDYRFEGYYKFYSMTGNRKADYGNAALFERISGWDSLVALKSAFGSNEAPSASYDSELKTAWCLVYPLLPEELRSKLDTWAQHDQEVAENFANYLKAGFLYASPVIVELYCWFVCFRRDYPERDLQASYWRFVEWVTPKIPDSLLFKYFVAAMRTFESLCEKIVDHGLREWQRDWSSLKRLTSPAWYASGENSEGRQRLILGFNTPFYPNVLVSTSVLQEGVNLHLQCYQVHHYGLAGSPGDNEQRIGRLDRLFGCVNQRLNTAGEKDMKIFYPYLQRSVDEDQVASFIERKHQVEEQMDACLQIGFDKTVQLSRVDDWLQFLRKPQPRCDTSIKDPYPAKFKDAGSLAYQPYPVHSNKQIFDWLADLVKRAIDPVNESFIVADESSLTGRTLYLVDPKVEHNGVLRHQPIFVSVLFAPEASALISDTVYFVSLVSPIANKVGLNEYLNKWDGQIHLMEGHIRQLNGLYPLAKLTLDDASGNSYLYLSARVDLPLFVKAGHLQMLSALEIQSAFNHLKAFSDALELLIHDGAQDLSVHDVRPVSHQLSDIAPGWVGRKTPERKPLEWRDYNNGSSCIVGLSHNMFSDSREFVGENLDLTGVPEDKFMASLLLNQRFPMVRFHTEESLTEMCLIYPKADLHPEERKFMECWFDHVRSLFN